MSDLFEDLKKLSAMRDAGEVTPEEYEVVKAELIAEIGMAPKGPTETRPPGWYNDPEGTHRHQAYWDGEKWTGQTRPDAGQIAQTSPTEKKPLYRRPWFIVLAVLFGLAAIGNALDGDSSPSNPSTDAAQLTADTASQDTESVAVTESDIPGTLGLIPAQFRSNWNAFIDEAQSPALRIASIDVDTGEVQDVFTVILSEQLSILGTVNKADGTIRDVQVWGVPSTDALAATDMILSWGALIASIDPSLSPTERGEVLEDLGIIGGDEWAEPGFEAEVVRNGVEYSFDNFLDGLGVLSFNAGDPSDSGLAP